MKSIATKLLLLCLLLFTAALSPVKAEDEPINFSIFSEDGHKFFLILSGVRMNDKPSERVDVKNYEASGNYFQFKIIWQDKKLETVKEEGFTLRDEDGHAVRRTFVIRKRKRGGFEIFTQDMVLSAAQKAKMQQEEDGGTKTPAPSRPTTRPTRKQTEPTKPSTTEKDIETSIEKAEKDVEKEVEGSEDGFVKRMENLANRLADKTAKIAEKAGDEIDKEVTKETNSQPTKRKKKEQVIHMVEKTDAEMLRHEKEFNTGPHKTPTPSPSSPRQETNPAIGQPVPSAPAAASINCRVAISSAALNRQIASLNKISFEQTKLKTALTNLRNSCMSVAQIKQVIALFSFEQSKLEYAKAAYAKCVDKDHFLEVGDDFSFDSSRDDLANFVNEQH